MGEAGIESTVSVDGDTTPTFEGEPRDERPLSRGVCELQLLLLLATLKAFSTLPWCTTAA